MWQFKLVLIVTLVCAFDVVKGLIRPPPKLKLPKNGALIGSYMLSSNRKVIEAYRGIPYAKPPVGELRFANPQPYPHWTDERIADHDAQPCPQQDRFDFIDLIDSTDKTFFGREDCLYLNVYSPQKRPINGSLSVMVFFHGGSFIYGGATSTIYGPQRLLDNNIVLVTANYRLGPLGFMSTYSADSPGNFGLKDQVMVLRWVKDNIDAFGGNPNDVTIFGQNSGAASVAYHLVSPMSAGLFHKAIMQSGNYFDPWAKISTEASVDRTRRIGEILNCTDPDGLDHFPEMMACLRSKSAEDIVSTMEDFYIIDGEPMNVFGPVVEPKGLRGTFITENPRTIQNSYGANVPVIIGVTSDEGLFKSAPIIYTFADEFNENFKELLPFLLMYEEIPIQIQDQITDQIEKYYFKNGRRYWSRKEHQNLTDVFSDRLFFLGLNEFVANRLRNSPPDSTFVYMFDHKGPKSLTQLYGGGSSYYGVAHGDELPFLFPLAQDHLSGKKNDYRMRWALPRMWTDFAKTGNPTPPRSPFQKWIPASKFPLNYARLGNRHNKSWNNAASMNNTNTNTSQDDKKKKGTTTTKAPPIEMEPIVVNQNKDQINEVIEKTTEMIQTITTIATTVTDQETTPVMDKPQREGRRHHSKSKKKSSKGHDYYQIVGNEVGFVERRMPFWRRIKAIIRKGEEEVALESK